MRNLFLILILMLAPAGLAAQEADPSLHHLLRLDNENAHAMAQVAIDAVYCFLAGTPAPACMAEFEPQAYFLGQEHELIHQQLQELEARKRS